MKTIEKRKKYLVYVNAGLLNFLGLEKSQDVLPISNRVNGGEEIIMDDTKFVLKCHFNNKQDALSEINNIIFRTGKILVDSSKFCISANKIAKVIKNEN